MLAFITSLRHPHNSDDYAHVEQLLRETLRSVTAQTHDDFHVFVVGNRAPSFELPRHTTFIGVDFPAPSATAGPQFDLGQFVWDKGTKIGIGLAAARSVSPDHVMIFDADDYVHRDLSALAASQPDSNGWVIDEGYILSRSRQAYRPQKRFFGVCGTSHIVKWEAFDVAPGLTTEASQEEVAEAFGDRLGAILGAHRNARIWLSKRGFKLQSLPFAGAVYQVDTGENHSGKVLSGLAHPLGRSLAAEFGIERRTSLVTAAARAWSPIAAIQSVRSAVAARRRRD